MQSVVLRGLTQDMDGAALIVFGSPGAVRVNAPDQDLTGRQKRPAAKHGPD